MTGVSVDFRLTFLSNAANLDAPLAVYSDPPSMVTDTKGEVRVYAGGRRREISKPGVTRVLTVKLVALTRAQKETLLSWAGQLVLYRDQHARRIWGTFLIPKEYDPAIEECYSVDVILTELSVVEGV